MEKRRFDPNAPAYQPVPPRIPGSVPNNDRQTQMPKLPAPTPPAYRKKRALLCGITYNKGNKRSIKSNINDVNLMKKFLIKRGFDDSSIVLLTEEEKDPSRIPTKKNIVTALQGLVKDCQKGDSLVFYYSGPGSKVQGPNRLDEVDRYHEALLPVDHETKGIILDDDINNIIVKPLSRDVTLHAIIDTCFNGTLLDLPYVSKMDGGGCYKWMDNPRPIRAIGGLAIFISACDDNQKSGEAAGALTESFVKALEEKPKRSYRDLLLAMHKRIGKAQQQGGSTKTAAPQEPKLSASEKNIYEMPCKLEVV